MENWGRDWPTGSWDDGQAKGDEVLNQGPGCGGVEERAINGMSMGSSDSSASGIRGKGDTG